MATGDRQVATVLDGQKVETIARVLPEKVDNTNGNKVRLFTTVKALDPAHYAGVEIIPTFAMFLYQEISTDPMWAAIENFVVHNRSFHRDLSRLDPSLFEDSVTVFPTLSENQVLGLVRWLATFPKEKRPRVAVGLRTPQEFTASNTRRAWLRR